MKTKEIAGMTFKDISSEEYRVYQFADMEVRIEKPQWMNFNIKSGGHRVLDVDGISHYIPTGWRHLYWKSENGFVF